MKFMLKLLLLILPLHICQGQASSPEFADLMVDSYYAKTNPNFQRFYGGTLANFPIAVNPDQILGGNTKNFLSLPTGSYVILKFTDNVIIDYPSQPDIFITEIGCNEEHAEVHVSSNGVDFRRLGVVDDCKTSALDLAAIRFKEQVTFVKIIGLDNKGESPGYDLVSVKGLPKSNVNTYVVMDSLDTYLANIDTSITRKIILSDIRFDFNSAVLMPVSKSTLDTLASKLLVHKEIEIKLTGHTDDIGHEEINLSLSRQRAKSVMDYLVSKGVNPKRITFTGKGESEPLSSNATEEGRTLNRRVEFEKVN